MTPQECLVAWMEAKSNYMNFPEYFNEEDKKDLLALDEEVAIRICARMFETVELERSNRGDFIYSEFCPFCSIQNGFGKTSEVCATCSYKTRHGKCGDAGSTWLTARRKFLSVDDEAEPLQEFFNTVMSETLDEFVNSRLTPGPDIE